MMTRVVRHVLALTLCVAVTGCSGLFGENDSTPTAPQAVTYSVIANDAVRIDQLESGAFSDIRDGRNLLIQDQEALSTLWGRIHADQSAPPSVPSVDFGESVVIAVIAGQRPTSGYEVDVNDIQFSPDQGRLEVSAVERQPSGACIVNQVLTSPFVLVRAQVEAPVTDATFNVTQEAYTCED